jgi:hypothetical protein
MHPRINQDAKLVSKNKEEKMKKIAHMSCYSCDTLGHLALSCPNKLEKKDQSNKEKQGNEKHNMSKVERLKQRESATHAGKGDTWYIQVP